MNVLVIGGSGFIGDRIAHELKMQGYKVFMTSSTAGKPGCARLDVMDLGSIEATASAFESMGGLYAIVYAVGDCPAGGYMNEISEPLTTVDPMKLQKKLDLHVTGLLNVVQGLWSQIARDGHLVVIGSGVTRLNNAQTPSFLRIGHSAAAKSAQNGLISWLRKDDNILGMGIKVHYLAPLAVEGPFYEGTPKQFLPATLTPARVIASTVAEALTMKNLYLDFPPCK